MPAPLLLARKSGLYCRVFVPSDLRPHLGQRYLIRALGARNKDEARLIAARYAWVVGGLFLKLRRELSMPEPKVDDVIKALQSGAARDLISITESTSASGAWSRTVTLENEEDARIAKKHLGLSFSSAARETSAKYRRTQAHSIAISERLKLFKTSLEESNSSKKYIDEFDHSVKILTDILGDMPPDDYTPDLIDTLVAKIKYLPPNIDKDKDHRERWAKLTYLQICNEVELLGMKKVSATTYKKHLVRLHTLFEFCRLRQSMDSPNPFEKRAPKSKSSLIKGSAQVLTSDGTAPAAETVRRPFDMDDLNRIFDPKRYLKCKMPHSFWPPLIALMTGARVNEVAQLYLDDIVDDDKDQPGRWRFMILAKQIDQRVKNLVSLRSIPVHPKLIELGFLIYLEDVRRLGYKRVFPTLRYTAAAGYGDTVSDTFARYLRNQVGITDPAKVFHSFRHYFCHTLFNKSKQERMHIVGMTGHEREGVFERTYAGESNYEKKLELLMKLPLPELQISPFKMHGFDKFFAAAERNKEEAKRKLTRKKEQSEIAVESLSPVLIK